MKDVLFYEILRLRKASSLFILIELKMRVVRGDKGLKIPWELAPVPVRFRLPAPFYCISP